jgi:hypothetical protein
MATKRKSPQFRGLFLWLVAGKRRETRHWTRLGWGQPKKGGNMDKLTTLYKQNKPYFVILARTTRK